jgi:c-di-GMP-binding flagellar brake protein YcgR
VNEPQRRAHRRARIDVDVIYSNSEAQTEARCDNMSLGGAFILTPAPLGFGVSIDVLIRFPGYSETRRLPATVRWRGTRGMGVQFSSLDAATTFELTEFLASRELAEEAG